MRIGDMELELEQPDVHLISAGSIVPMLSWRGRVLLLRLKTVVCGAQKASQSHTPGAFSEVQVPLDLAYLSNTGNGLIGTNH